MTPADREFTAGVARRDVTPPQPRLLQPTGMARTEPTRGVLDPLEVGALAVGTGDAGAIVLTSDLRRFFPRWVAEVSQRVVERTGCDPERILFSATHCHSSSPDPADDSEAAGAAHAEAERVIVDGLVEAACEAWRSRRSAELAVTRSELDEPVGRNRRTLLSDGTVVNCWHEHPITPPGRRLVGPAGPDSRMLAVVAVRELDAEQPFGLLVSYATHPHLEGLPWFSAELPGGVRRALADRLPGAEVLTANHAGGDIDLHDVFPGEEGDADTLARWFTATHDRLGVQVADAVVAALEAGPDWRRPAALRHVYEATREPARGQAPTMILRAVALGDAVLANIPGEMFHEFAIETDRRSPFARTVLLGYNGSNCAYLAPPLGFEQGGYEVMHGTVAPGEVELMPGGTRVKPTTTTGREIIDRMAELLEQLHAMPAE